MKMKKEDSDIIKEKVQVTRWEKRQRCKKVVIEAAKDVLAPEERRKCEWRDDECKRAIEEGARAWVK